MYMQREARIHDIKLVYNTHTRTSDNNTIILRRSKQILYSTVDR